MLTLLNDITPKVAEWLALQTWHDASISLISQISRCSWQTGGIMSLFLFAVGSCVLVVRNKLRRESKPI